MNSEQKGGVKNHFQTLFRIIKKKLQIKNEKEQKEKIEAEKKQVKIKKDNIVVYATSQKIKSKSKEIKSNNINDKKDEIKLVQIKKEQKEKIIPKVSEKQNLNIIEKKNNIDYRSQILSSKKNSKINIEKKDNNKSKIVSPPKINKFKKSVNTYEEDKKQKTKNKLEESILKRINKIILEDKNDIDSLKYKLYEIDKSIYNANDREELDKLKKQFEIISEKIKKIKRDFEIIKESIYLENYEQIDNYFLLEEIDDFKYSNSLESVELLSMKCKQQIDVLDDIVEMYENVTNSAEKIVKQSNQVQYFEYNTNIINEQTEEIDLISKKINNNLNLQNKFIDDMNRKIGESQKDVKIYYEYKGLNDLINNSLLIGLGMYSSPTKKTHFKGLKFLVGSFLIYNSIRGMLKFLSPEMKKVTYIYYKDYTKELESESSRIILTYNLLNHSLKDVSILKKEFKDKFMEYQYQLPDYDIMLEKIDKIEKQLKLQKKELNNIDKNLEIQKQKNKEYIKKIEKIEE